VDDGCGEVVAETVWSVTPLTQLLQRAGSFCTRPSWPAAAVGLSWLLERQLHLLTCSVLLLYLHVH
jgi:hypothetical protein